MTDIILGIIIVGIVGGAVAYIRKQRKNGVKCIGCPDAKTCSGNCSGCNGGCCGHTDTK